MVHLNKAIVFLSVFSLSAILSLSCNSGPVDKASQQDPALNSQIKLSGGGPDSDPLVVGNFQIMDGESKVPTVEASSVNPNVGESYITKGLLSGKERTEIFD